MDPDEVVSAALGMLDRDGLEAFSMRRLASELGVSSMATYYHFPSKAALLAEVYQHAFAERPVPESGGPWLDEALALAHWIRSGYLAHPVVVSLRSHVPWPTPASVHLSERWLAVLSRAGFRGARLATAYHTATAAILGLVEQEATQATRPITKDLERAIEEAPRLKAILPELRKVAPRKAFEGALRILFQGLLAENESAERDERRPRANRSPVE
jgi:AcrR family transcriptional regulator